MSGINNLSSNQFRSEAAISAQGNPEEMVRSRGIQKMNVPNPLPFTFDYMQSTANPSSAKASPSTSASW